MRWITAMTGIGNEHFAVFQQTWLLLCGSLLLLILR